jgi:hypothetical protein
MSKSCSKCGRSMEEGFVVDKGDYDAARVESWFRGEPEQKWWGLKYDKASALRIMTWRCTSCGFLESYAR